MIANKLKIDIVSDIVCPWCVIGFKKLSIAMQDLKNEAKFDIHWKAYQLHPEIPKEGFDKEEYMKIKFGESGGSRSRFDFIIEEGKKVGIEFNFDKTKNLPNTFLAHRLLWFSKSKGIQDVMAEALFEAYFSEGRDVGSMKELISISNEKGLNKDEIKDFLKSDIGSREVSRQELRAREMNIFSIPTYVINKKYSLVGGQEPDTFKAYIRKVIEVESKHNQL